MFFYPSVFDLILSETLDQSDDTEPAISPRVNGSLKVFVFPPAGWFLCCLSGLNEAWSRSLSVCVPAPARPAHTASSWLCWRNTVRLGTRSRSLLHR